MTALTLTETLSREMTSWTGTLSTRTRRSTRTAFCTPGTMNTSPGPRTPAKRPSVKTTKRSYSRSTENPRKAIPRRSATVTRIRKELLELTIETSLVRPPARLGHGFFSVPVQDVISRDNVSVKVSAVIYYRVSAPDAAIIQVEDFAA